MKSYLRALSFWEVIESENLNVSNARGLGIYKKIAKLKMKESKNMAIEAKKEAKYLFYMN